MSAALSTDADHAFEQELHARLLDGDPIAPSELFVHFSLRLYRRLAVRFASVRDEQLIEDAVTDALFGYSQRPQPYNPEKGSLSSYLYMAAQGDLKNALEKRQRRRRREIPFDPVAHDRAGGNSEQEATAGMESLLRKLPPGLTLDAVKAQVWAAFPDDTDRQLLQLLLDDVRPTPPYAAVLRLDGQPLAQQRAAVKRHKDRIKVKLRRLQKGWAQP